MADPRVQQARERAHRLLLDRDGNQWIEPHEITDDAAPELVAARDVLFLADRIATLETALREISECVLHHWTEPAFCRSQCHERAVEIARAALADSGTESAQEGSSE